MACYYGLTSSKMKIHRKYIEIWLLLIKKHTFFPCYFTLRSFKLISLNFYVNFQFIHLEEWSMDNNMVSKIWVNFNVYYTNIHLPQFKIQSHLQKRGILIRTHTKEKPFNITLHSPFCLFLKKTKNKKQTNKQTNNNNNKKKKKKKLNCHPESFGVYRYFSWRNHLMPFNMVHSNTNMTKNAKSRVRQFQVTWNHWKYQFVKEKGLIWQIIISHAHEFFDYPGK